MNLSDIIRQVGEYARQFPHLDLDIRSICDRSIEDIQRACSTWSWLKTETTATINSGASSAVFTNANEFRALQMGGATPVTVSDTSVTPTVQLPVEVLTHGEIQRLNSRGGFGTRAYNAFTSLQEPVYITRNSSLAGVVNVTDTLDSARTYTIKAYILLPALSATTDTNVITEDYGELVLAKARASMFQMAGDYDSAAAERALYKELLTDAIRQDAYTSLGGRPVRM